MKVINFTNTKLQGATSATPLIYDLSSVKKAMKGVGTSDVANTVCQQIKSQVNAQDAIILDLPLLLTVEVEGLLAKQGIVRQVFYYIGNRLMSSPAFEHHLKRIEQSNAQVEDYKQLATI